MLKARTSEVLKKDAADVRCAAYTGMTLRRLAGIGFQPSDEARQIIRRDSIVCDYQQRKTCQKDYWLEILQNIVLKRVHCSVYNVRAPRTKTERVTIRH